MKIEHYLASDIAALILELEDYNAKLISNYSENKAKGIHKFSFRIIYEGGNFGSGWSMNKNSFLAKELAFKSIKGSFDAIKHALKKVKKKTA